MKIILASRSPRRRYLLEELGFDFEIIKPGIDESRLENETPENLCERLAKLKAKTVSEKFHDYIVIAADTIVVIDNKILGKPKNRHDAFRMLRNLQNREHEVMTGIALFDILPTPKGGGF